MGTTVKRKIKFKSDKYTDHVINAFDLQVHDRTIGVEIDIPSVMTEDFNIGLIVGNSGSGKSIILEQLGYNPDDEYMWNDKSICSNFPEMTPEEVTDLFSSIGLSSVPNWLKPYKVLSEGEKHRANLAKIISDHQGFKGSLFMDEYTSVVNRDVAKAMSNSLQKYVRKNNKKIILASCHYDVIDWLQPDWIYDAQTGDLVKKKSEQDLKSTLQSFVAITRHGNCSAHITI